MILSTNPPLRRQQRQENLFLSTKFKFNLLGIYWSIYWNLLDVMRSPKSKEILHNFLFVFFIVFQFKVKQHKLTTTRPTPCSTGIFMIQVEFSLKVLIQQNVPAIQTQHPSTSSHWRHVNILQKSRKFHFSVLYLNKN